MFRLVQVSNDDRTNETMLERKNEQIFVRGSFLGNDCGTRVFLIPPSFLAERGRPNEDGMKKVGWLSYGVVPSERARPEHSENVVVFEI